MVQYERDATNLSQGVKVGEFLWGERVDQQILR
jgi:hypothetical protein